MANRSILLEAIQLTKRFSRQPVLRGVELRIAAGEAVALTGDNGAGKTTLLRCLAWLARPTSGEVFWLGLPAARQRDDRRLIGVAWHECSLYPFLTARENLVFAARMYGLHRPRVHADRWIECARLAACADRAAGTLSRGQRQRVALARALIHGPSVLLLDEPFAGLDALGTAWLTQQLCECRERGQAVRFSTHDGSIAQNLGDRTLQLAAGRLLDQPAVGPMSLPAA